MPPEPPEHAIKNPQSVSEHRQLTMLFCDLAGSTELSHRLDPEDFHALVRTFLLACDHAVSELGGYVARYAGDGLLAYFGFPAAGEDDRDRAVRAALAVQLEAGRLQCPDGTALEVRCGVATGPTIVGEMLGVGEARERMVFGSAAALAARLQSVAHAGEVVVCNKTLDGLGADLAIEPVTPLSLKGFPTPVSAFRVRPGSGPASPARRRFRAGTPLVGRETELARLEEAFGDAQAGLRRVIYLEAEAGLGKTRLILELEARTRSATRDWRMLQAAQLFCATPFHPIIRFLLERLGSPAAGDADTTLRLRRWCEEIGSRAEAFALVAELLGLATSHQDAPLALTAELRRARLMRALVELLTRPIGRGLIVLIVEDLHWADASTLEVLALLREVEAPGALLAILSSRPGPLRPSAVPDGTVNLDRLAPDQTHRLVEGIAGAPPPGEKWDAIVARSDGVPLFAEELAYLVLDQGAQAGQVPSTLSSLLMARLDQAGDARTLAQMASVLGQESTHTLLAAMSGDPTGTPERVSRLRSMGVFTTDNRPDTAVAFRHALIREVAYDTMLRETRRALHRRAAMILQDGLPGLPQARPEVVALHWSRADEPGRALEGWTMAARHAFARRAFPETAALLQEALRALEALPAEDQAVEREMELLSLQVSLLQITRGYSAPETMEATAIARLRAERRGRLDHQIGQLANSWISASSAGRYAEALALGGQLRPLAVADGRPERIGVAAMMQVTSLYRTGNLEGAEDAFLAARRAFASAAFQRQPGAIPQTLGNAAIVAWLIGKTSTARARLERATRISARKNEPYEQAFTAFMFSTVDLLGGDDASAEARATVAMSLAAEHGFPQFTATASITLGAARGRLGYTREGVGLIRDGLAAMTETRSRAGLSMYRAWLAECHWLGGDAGAAREVISHALADGGEERFFRPELLRLDATLLDAAGRRQRAHARCLEALDDAKRIGARALHRRALGTLRELST